MDEWMDSWLINYMQTNQTESNWQNYDGIIPVTGYVMARHVMSWHDMSCHGTFPTIRRWSFWKHSRLP